MDKYSRYEHNFSGNVVSIYILTNNDHALISSIAYHVLLTSILFLFSKVAVNEIWNEKAKFIFTLFSWHHLSYIYVDRYYKVFPSIDLFSVQTDFLLLQKQYVVVTTSLCLQ